MGPIIFWLLGGISLAAAFLAVAHRRPQRSTQGLVALMMTNAVILFLLHAPLLAVELLVVTIGAVLVVWMVLVRPGRQKLGAPGRTRYNVTKFIAFFVALWLFGVIVLAIFTTVQPTAEIPAGRVATGGFGAVISVFLLGVAAATASVVVMVQRRDAGRADDGRGESD